MVECEARFVGYGRNISMERRRQVRIYHRGALCALSYDDDKGFMTCRGARSTHQCPRGLDRRKDDVAGNPV